MPGLVYEGFVRGGCQRSGADGKHARRDDEDRGAVEVDVRHHPAQSRPRAQPSCDQRLNENRVAGDSRCCCADNADDRPEPSRCVLN